jgi:hypothetical protein
LIKGGAIAKRGRHKEERERVGTASHTYLSWYFIRNCTKRAQHKVSGLGIHVAVPGMF